VLRQDPEDTFACALLAVVEEMRRRMMAITE
jgi:hypothetical protein